VGRLDWEKKPNKLFEGLGYSSSSVESPESIPDIAFSAVPLATDAAQYMRINVPGRFGGLLSGSDEGAELEVALNDPVVWVAIAAGEAFADGSRPFDRIFIRRPSRVPADAARFFRFWISQDRPLNPGPLPPRVLNAGSSVWTPTGATANPGLAVNIVAARPGRRKLRIRNVSAAPKVIAPVTSGGFAVTLGQQEVWEETYTGAVWAALLTDWEIEEFYS
jgi:hypothetical protein